jgi:hypothetical protein
MDFRRSFEARDLRFYSGCMILLVCQTIRQNAGQKDPQNEVRFCHWEAMTNEQDQHRVV